MFYAEQTVQYFDSEKQMWFREIDDKPSPFQSIPDAFWWAMVTMCRIPGLCCGIGWRHQPKKGYGQEYPVSGLGKFVATVASIIGILAVAFPVAVIGQTFKDLWKEYTDNRKKKKKLKDRLKLLKFKSGTNSSETSKSQWIDEL
jgi:hypothetical protein